MTPEELLDEMLAYYGEHQRGVSPHGGCAYRNPSYEGQEVYCAVGRCLDWDNLPSRITSKLERSSKVFSLLVEEFEHALAQLGLTSWQDILQERYRDIPVEFWTALQSLHDTSWAWVPHEGGRPGFVLSLRGRQYVALLRESIKTYHRTGVPTFPIFGHKESATTG